MSVHRLLHQLMTKLKKHNMKDTKHEILTYY